MDIRLLKRACFFFFMWRYGWGFSNACAITYFSEQLSSTTLAVGLNRLIWIFMRRELGVLYFWPWIHEFKVTRKHEKLILEIFCKFLWYLLKSRRLSKLKVKSSIMSDMVPNTLRKINLSRKINESRYIALFVFCGSIKKLFSIYYLYKSFSFENILPNGEVWGYPT